MKIKVEIDVDNIDLDAVAFALGLTPKDGKYLFEMAVSQKDAANFKKILALPVFCFG